MACCGKKRRLEERRRKAMLSEKAKLTEAQRKIKDIVKNPRWQKVRKSLLGQWRPRPEWCCNQLKKFLGPLSSASNDELRIVMNYLTGTAFRTGKVKHPCIAQTRAQISSEIKVRKAKKKW